MFKNLFSLFNKNKSEEIEPREELSPEEKIRSQFKVTKRTYGDGRVVFIVESLDWPVCCKSLEEAKKILDDKVKAALAEYIVSNEVVE